MTRMFLIIVGMRTPDKINNLIGKIKRKMKNRIIINIFLKMLVYIIAALTLFSSCSNNHEGNIIKNGEVVIDLLGVSSADNIQKEGSIAYDKNGDQVTQEFERIPFGDEGISLDRSEEHTSELQSRENLVCRLLLEKKK